MNSVMPDFTYLLHSDNECPAVPHVLVSGLAQAGRAGFFDDAGYPVSAGWYTIDFPNLVDADAYALDVCGESMEPVYREGYIVIVSPNTSVLPGDRVLANTARDEILAKDLVKTSMSEVRLASINAVHSELVLLRAKVVWISRRVGLFSPLDNATTKRAGRLHDGEYRV
tara:strand:+ start:2428 stop:2934 length:507 start_codon:yes stop_codon:yes gene_type:complete